MTDEMFEDLKKRLTIVESRLNCMDEPPTVPTWCEAIPEITPEPGDICETDAGDIFLVEAETDGRFYDERGIGYDRADLRVLARKPLGAIEAHDAINAFFNALMDTDTQSGEVEAYKSFLRAILGTVYGRVDK